jgi:hypothetical protein
MLIRTPRVAAPPAAARFPHQHRRSDFQLRFVVARRHAGAFLEQQQRDPQYFSNRLANRRAWVCRPTPRSPGRSNASTNCPADRRTPTLRGRRGPVSGGCRRRRSAGASYRRLSTPPFVRLVDPLQLPQQVRPALLVVRRHGVVRRPEVANQHGPWNSSAKNSPWASWPRDS